MIHRSLAVLSLLALGGAIALADNVDKTRQDDSSRWPRIRLGGIFVGAGYSHFSGRPYYGYQGWAYGPAFYDPFFYGISLFPGNVYGYSQQTGRGQVKLHAVEKAAAVFINGAFAGEAGKLRTIWLDPGVYDLEVKAGAGPSIQKRVYVLSGKSLKVDADTSMEKKQ